jgi:photosystem II stability/assembly factor-like uncharacterized protein
MGKSWQNAPLPQDVVYSGMAFVDNQRAFIVGESGTVLVSNDAGKTWQQQDVKATEHLIDVTFAGQSGWIVGESGLVLHTTDGGRTWERQQSNTVQGLTSVSFPDAQNGWAVGWVGTVLRTKDGGKTWEEKDIADASWSLNTVHFSDAKNGWILGMFGQMLRTTDGGETWQLKEMPSRNVMTAIYADSANRAFAASDYDILVSKDGGDKWESANINRWLFFKRILPVGKAIWSIGTFQIMQLDPATGKWDLMLNVPSSADLQF